MKLADRCPDCGGALFPTDSHRCLPVTIEVPMRREPAHAGLAVTGEVKVGGRPGEVSVVVTIPDELESALAAEVAVSAAIGLLLMVTTPQEGLTRLQRALAKNNINSTPLAAPSFGGKPS